MAEEVLGTAVLELTADDSQLTKGVQGAKVKSEGIFRGMVSSAVKMAAAVGIAFSAVKVASWLKNSVHAAADLEIQQRRINTIFGPSAGIIEKFGASAAKSFGLSHLAADTMTASLGQVFTSMGINKKQSAGMSLGVTKLAADLASFTGKDPAKVFDALYKGSLGATRGLKAYGINISSADVKAQALASGLVKPIKSTKDLTEAQAKHKIATENLSEAIKKHGGKSLEAQKANLALERASRAVSKAMEGTVPALTTSQKAQAAYQLILKKGAIASGDFKKHSGDLGNAQKILAAQFANISTTIGGVLLPVVVTITTWFGSNLPKAFDVLTQAVQGIIASISSFVDWLNQGGTAAEIVRT